MKIKLMVDGGAMKPGPAVAQQLGPAGINLGKVIADVNAATAGFQGTKVPVEIDADTKTKTYTISVFSPPVAELLKKELGLEKGSGVPNKTKVGNIAMERVIHVAKTKMANLLAKDLKSAVKLVVGSCVSLGILVDNKNPKDIENEIDQGKYDKEIKQEITEVSPVKKKELEAFFKEVVARQEKEKKAAEEAAAAAEAAKQAALLAAGGAAAPGAAPAAGAATAPAAAGAKVAATPAAAPAAAGAKPAAGKAAAPAKAEAKKK